LVPGLLYTEPAGVDRQIPGSSPRLRVPATAEYDPCIESSARKSWRLMWSGSGSKAAHRPQAQPGQFVIVRTGEDGERIPLTIADVDKARGAISIIVQGVGKSTRQLNALNEGDAILDLAGPLGRATEIHPGRKVCCIGGGIGTAVVYPIACGVKALHGEVVAIIGGRSKDLVILEKELRAVVDQVIVTTDDGSYGEKGLVTDALKALLAEGRHFDEVVAVGPLPMMRAVVDVTRPLGIPTTVSLNPVMVDGTGMCGGCRVSVGGEQRFVCVDGPEFDGPPGGFRGAECAPARLPGAGNRVPAPVRPARRLPKPGQLICARPHGAESQSHGEEDHPEDQEPHAAPGPPRAGAQFRGSRARLPGGPGGARGQRCIQCKNEPCIAGCPVEIDIPQFIKQVAERDFEGAYRTLMDRNVLPAICGRVCPQEEQCEIKCTLGVKNEPVAIGRLERFVADYGALLKFTDDTPPAPPTGHKVAVVGSGPAGLTVGGGPGEAGTRRDDLRGPAQGRRRARVRHPRIPAAEGDR